MDNMNNLVLEATIEMYGKNKATLDELKKVCDKDNKKIKAMMVDGNHSDFKSANYVAKYYESERTNFDSEKALAILKRAGINQCVKTIEVLDEDVLESMLYNDEIPKEILPELNDCTEVKKVPTLKVNIRKEK